jgi:bifunctional UDP-N-acetylglucosamine pyrophosphorylase/glucosamine-1-phosphate N-acetyltransferase
LQAIIEAQEADEDVLAIPLCNSGIMAVDGTKLFGLLERIRTDNAKGEYYLTDLIALARADGLDCLLREGGELELMGINTRIDLAAAEAVAQLRLRARAMEQGATLIDPASIYFSFDTYLGRDVTVEPNVFFGPGVTIGDSVNIKSFCHIEGATIQPGASVGPFARLRPGAGIGTDARIGNFVEIKQATVESGAKVSHLSYIGDARIGAGANIGAGTITCNYDGVDKFLTEIGAGAFIGSNTALVAPVRVGDGATIGAGSVITRDVADQALAITRPAQNEIEGWAQRQKAKQNEPGDKS